MNDQTDKVEQLLDGVKFGDNDLVPAVIQDATDGTVLMVGYMDRKALKETMTSGRTCFWSRSRQTYWRKGETSGHIQKVREVAIDCDADTVLVKVDQVGPACHTNHRSCFYRWLNENGDGWEELEVPRRGDKSGA